MRVADREPKGPPRGRSGPQSAGEPAGLEVARQRIAELEKRLAEEAARREEILSVVSHELRTPVTVIAGYHKLLLEEDAGPLNVEQRHFLNECHKSCQRLDHFIGNLVDVSGEMAAHRLRVREVQIESLVSDVIGFLHPLLESAHLRVRASLDPDVPSLQCDRRRIEQVLTNLIVNATKYARDGEEVEVVSRALDRDGESWIELVVLDRGPGVPEADRGRIFEPYERGAREHGAVGSLGLGLAICRAIALAHGGSIDVTARSGGGSRFALCLPAAHRGEPGA